MLTAALLHSACSPQEQLPAGTDSPTTARSAGAFACSSGGGTRFPSPLLEGPELSPEEFVDTQVGGTLHDFFTEGEGAVENDHFDRADGFSIVSEDLVLGYIKGLPNSTFHLADGEIRGWGGCNPTRVNGDLVAARWEPPPVVDIQALTIPIHVEGGACVTESGQEVITELVEVELDEREDRVEVTAWTRAKAFEGACAGVGIVIDASVDLEEPLDGRPLFNGGPIPPEQLEFAASDGPPPSTTIDDSDEWSLGRLDCSPGILVENRVPDSGQEPIEVAQEAAPATVEIESGEPLWWWGLNQNGAVIVAVALGDSADADYQVWTCDPPLGEEAATP